MIDRAHQLSGATAWQAATCGYDHEPVQRLPLYCLVATGSRVKAVYGYSAPPRTGPDCPGGGSRHGR